ncbi:lamin tail domain-containing protein [Mucisphaera sp.]|uniref:lamin tail domain-containing protein n=1 Tax=Mucisphaera sp. TaxID=2913024 RepID=UPI003D0A87F8
MIDAAVAMVITEIRYNPASSEKQPVRVEWVEVYNRSDVRVDLSGWYLADEDGESSALAEGTVLEGGAALVLIPEAQHPRNFAAGWPVKRRSERFDVAPLDGWRRGGFGGLANQPSATNEILALHRGDGSVADVVNFDDAPPWPEDSPEGGSIYLKPDAIDPALNDRGESWALSEGGVDGARHAMNRGGYSEKDVGSPGVVVVAAEEGGGEAD